jgi:hypothetical protein
MAAGYKFIYRPTGTLTLVASSGVGTGHFVFDTSGTISISGQVNLQPSTAGASNNTIEFTKTAIWTGAGTSAGKPNFYLNSASGGFAGATFSLLMTVDNPLSDFIIAAPAGNTVNVVFPNKIISNSILFRSSDGAQFSTTTLNVFGSGGFSASSVCLESNRATNLTYGTMNLKLSADATYIATYLYTSGILPTTAGGSPSICNLSSITASVPVTMTITSGAYAYTQITDINNTGTDQYALTANGNLLTRTTGFISTPSSGGAGSSFTFVN